MAETTDEVIFNAEIALNEKEFKDAKKYVEQALKQVSDEESDYISTLTEKDENKEEVIAQWYAKCAGIFFKSKHYWRSLSCSWKAAVFSDQMEINSIVVDKRWLKLVFSQPRDRLLRLHKTLSASNDLDDSASLAFKLGKWERSLEIDHTIVQIFILLRNVFLIGPNEIWSNQGRHEAFKRMAKCYLNLNDHDNTREYCKLILEHLSDYDDIDALEIFARSLLATQSFKSAAEYCKLAIDCESSKCGSVRKRLQKLQAEICTIEKSSTHFESERESPPAEKGHDQSQEKEMQRQQQGKKRSKQKRRRPKAKSPSDSFPRSVQGSCSQKVSSKNNQQDPSAYTFPNNTNSLDLDEPKVGSTITMSSKSFDPQIFGNVTAQDECTGVRGNREETFYEKSKNYVPGENEELDEIIEIQDWLKNGITLTDNNRTVRCDSRKKYYSELLDIGNLQKKMKEEPHKYVRCVLQIKGAHESVCTPLDTRKSSPINIFGRSKAGQTFMEDEVVVETFNSDKSCGRVVGILDRKRQKGIKHPVFLCTIDNFDNQSARPICKTIPKIKLHHVNKNNSRSNQNKFVFLYNIGEFEVPHKKIHANELTASIIIVAYIKWSIHFQYPLGVVIRIQKEELMSSTRLLSLRHNLPFLYHENTVKHASELEQLDDLKTTHLQNRTDLTTLDVFTIDELSSKDLDDALSIESIKSKSNVYRVGVHIADVASIVQKDSECDIEAKERATTFYSELPDNKTRHMFPEPLSTKAFSLMPGKLRLTLSVFFEIDLDGNFRLERVCKSFIKSSKQFSYTEAQSILGKDITNKLDKDIHLLNNIAKSLRYQRLGNASFAVNSLSDEKSYKSRYLIEEFMILTNKEIAYILCKSFPGFIPLRSHPEPTKEDLEQFCKTNSCYIDTVLKMQNKRIPNRNTPCFKAAHKSKESVLVKDEIWKIFKTAPEKAGEFLKKDELFPFQYLVWQHWLKIQEPAFYVTGEESAIHFDMETTHYVQCTSPIRRFNDIIIQRILHAYLNGENKCPYEKQELSNIYSNINIRLKASADFKKECLTLKLATELKTNPQMMCCYISDISDKGFEFECSKLSRVPKNSMQILFNTLQVHTKPMLKTNGTTQRPEANVSWIRRIFAYFEEKSFRTERLSSTQLNPHMGIVALPISSWVSILDFAFNKTKDIRKLTNKIKQIEKLTLSNNSVTDDINISSVNQNEPYQKYSISYQYGQTVNVQMSADLHRGILIPKPVLYQMTENIKMCLLHVEDPVMWLTDDANVTKRSEYSNSRQYVERWIPLMSMEAATCSISNADSVCINDIVIKRTGERTGQFSLSRNFCESIHLRVNGMDDGEDENKFDKMSNDWLCIKFTLPKLQNTQDEAALFGFKDKESVHVSHAHVVTAESSSEEELVSFELHKRSTYPKDIATETLASIEIIQKTLEERRSIYYVNQLKSLGEASENHLAESIALRRNIEPLDIIRVKQANTELLSHIPREVKLPPDNDLQREAIQTALKNRFTLIQGPPGTGKTNTAMKLIYLFDRINQIVSDAEGKPRKKVMFCGPSNKSVDLVADLMLKRMGSSCPNIIRVYGQTIEENHFPVPFRLPKNASADDRLKSVTLHHLIRKEGRKYAKELKSFDNKFKNYRDFSSKDVSSITEGYLRLVRKASIEEIRQHDVIICTVSVATSLKVVKGADIYQIIIDEAAMCQEPQCLAPIIGNKVEQVVLIGDHKQLKPIITCRRAKEYGLDTSLFERYGNVFESKGNITSNLAGTVLTHKGMKFIQLIEQYRMDPFICKFPSSCFYNRSLITPDLPNVLWAQHPFAIHLLDIRLPHVLIDVRGDQNIQNVSDEDGHDKSRSNEAEVDQVVKVYKYLKGKGIPQRSIRILSQYNAQCSKIKMAMPDKNGDIVSSVVSSQGGEWDYIIFSTVCSLPEYMIEDNPSRGWCKQNLGFITDQNQINVALTRARKCLIIIGNKALLSCDSIWKDLISYYTSNGCVFSPDEFPPKQRATRKRPELKGAYRKNIPGLS